MEILFRFQAWNKYMKGYLNRTQIESSFWLRKTLCINPLRLEIRRWSCTSVCLTYPELLHHFLSMKSSKLKISQFLKNYCRNSFTSFLQIILSNKEKFPSCSPNNKCVPSTYIVFQSFAHKKKLKQALKLAKNCGTFFKKSKNQLYCFCHFLVTIHKKMLEFEWETESCGVK